jgi:hypothetical protein
MVTEPRYGTSRGGPSIAALLQQFSAGIRHVPPFPIVERGAGAGHGRIRVLRAMR